MSLTSGSSPVTALPAALQRRSRLLSARWAASRALRGELISLAGLIGAPVRNQAGEEVARLVDFVARIYGGDEHPPVSGLVLSVGRRWTFLDAAAIASADHRSLSLRTARVDLREFTRRPGEVLLARDVLDHQLVDIDGVQVIRASDLYLLAVGAQIRLVGVDVSLQTLLRRLGPRSLQRRPTPDRVIDWAAVEPFGSELTDSPAAVRLRSPHAALRRLRPGELADMLEDLGRPGRQELLASLDTATVADALEEMDAAELEALLREAEPEQAARLVAAMEPDEAVDALRDLSAEERTELLERMPERTARQLATLLQYPEGRAGGFMTSVVVRAHPQETVATVRERLIERADHRGEIDAVAVVDDHGRLIADITLFDLITAASPDLTLEALMNETTAPLTVAPDADVAEVAGRLVESRRSSLLVVDEDARPLGRILGDDVLDAQLPEHARLRFPRLLS